MKKILEYLVQHVRQDFHPVYYGAVFLFLSVCITLNFRYDIEDSFLDTRTGLTKFLFYFLSHAVAYFIPVGLGYFLGKKKFRFTLDFFLRSTIALALLSLERSVFHYNSWPLHYFDHAIQYWAFKVINNLTGVFFIIIPLFVFYYFNDRNRKNFYGLNSLPIDLKPYVFLLVLMLPVVIAVSFDAGFRNQYPMFDDTQAHLFLRIPQWITVAVYEFAYAINFISIEFFYRGFMVLGMIALLGRSAILPMACLYCFLHFGKPAAEAVSSIFGGYILGVIVYETRSIWGGILVHVGIAWLMELAAFFQHMARD